MVGKHGRECLDKKKQFLCTKSSKIFAICKIQFNTNISLFCLSFRQYKQPFPVVALFPKHWLNLNLNIFGKLTCRQLEIRLTVPQCKHIYRGYYTVARRYEFYVRVARAISHSFTALTREIFFLPRGHKNSHLRANV